MLSKEVCRFCKSIDEFGEDNAGLKEVEVDGEIIPLPPPEFVVDESFYENWLRGWVVCPYNDRWCQSSDESHSLFERSGHMITMPPWDGCKFKALHLAPEPVVEPIVSQNLVSKNSLRDFDIDFDKDPLIQVIEASIETEIMSKSVCMKCININASQKWNDEECKGYYRRSDDDLWEEGYVRCPFMYFELDKISIYRDPYDCPYMLEHLLLN